MSKSRRKSRVTPMAAEITSTLREMSRGHRNVHPEIWARWLTIVGPEMYRRAFPKALRGTTLIVGVSNSSWLQEISYLSNSLLDKLAEAVGQDVVTEIRFVLDTAVGKFRPGNEGAAQRRPAQPFDGNSIDPDLLKTTNKIEDAELRDSIRRAAAAHVKKDDG